MNIQFSHSLLFFGSLLAFPSCEDGNSSSTGSDITASEVSFDNDQTDLNSTNTQDALIEIGTKPDISQRIVFVDEEEDVAPFQGQLVIEAVCPGTSMAIGGGCETNFTNHTLNYSSMLERGYRCVWNTEFDTSATLSVRVACLTDSP